MLRGGGDLATGVAWQLRRAGWPVVVLELPEPLTVRRTVALSTAVTEGEVTVQGMRGVLVDSARQAAAAAGRGDVAVMVAPDLAAVAGGLAEACAELPVSVPVPASAVAGGLAAACATESEAPFAERSEPDPVSLAPRPGVVVDARLAKRNIDTSIDDADLVVALGPGFVAGADCHAVVETMRGPRLGRVIWSGSAQADTGIPAEIAGRSADRVLRAGTAGEVAWRVGVGDPVVAGQRLGEVGGVEVPAPFDGVLRGAIRAGTAVPAGLKIGDVDPRGDPAACWEISDKSLAVGTGVLEAVQAGLLGAWV